MSILFVSPPLCDPTQCYSSLPILQGFLKKENIDMAIQDWNLEGHLYLIEKYSYESILEIFHSEELFYQDEKYSQAKTKLLNLYQLISNSHYQFSNNSNFDLHGPWNIKRLKKYYRSSSSPFHEFYHSKITSLQGVDWLGLSCTFVSQLPEVFYIAQLVRSIQPNIKIIVGGPAVGQICEYATDDLLKQMLSFFDYICFDDGEPCLKELFAVSEVDYSSVPNLIFESAGQVCKTVRVKCRASDYATPSFEGIFLDQYFSPVPTILLNPSRGCYWNRCSFCHYGFNQVDGATYREMDATAAVDQVQILMGKYGVDNFYLSADVLSPKFVTRFATEILSRKIKCFWSTDLRIENLYSAEVCSLFKKAGMVSVAFGIESGNDKVLQLMDKGITEKQICSINKNFSDVGIATCWMTFNYHPGERLQDALGTFDLIAKHRKNISLFIVGEFGLCCGSKIYRSPEKYGVDEIYFHPDDQFKLYPYYSVVPNANLSENFKDSLDKKLDQLTKDFRLSAYPFKGAISTHHSFLHFKKYGKNYFHR